MKHRQCISPRPNMCLVLCEQQKLSSDLLGLKGCRVFRVTDVCCSEALEAEHQRFHIAVPCAWA